MKDQGIKGHTGSLVTAIVAVRWRFLFLFVFMFGMTLFLLSMVGLVPERITEREPAGTEVAYASREYAGDPKRILIPSVGVDANIENPQSREIEALDRALKEGVVRYPGTGVLTENANIFLFGHSSYLPSVINKNYQVFNNLQKLGAGDEIFVDSGDMRYVYRVTSVVLDEAGNVVVDFSRGERMLTLATCNSFGEKDERYVVRAKYVGSYLLTI
ncbi:MAG: sortase [Candidatus Pacebacteria bacterium]|nr:sortase [Candidatus Paceibacterota bacterium]